MIQVDMEKPTQCISCPMWALTYVHARNAVDICNQQKKPVNPYSVPDWCPLKELKPHGRLIDADALKQNTYEIYDPMGIIEAVPVDVIDNAPTVIPAEPEEES